MSIDAIVGGQWGDEGKGKIVDLLSKKVRHCSYAIRVVQMLGILFIRIIIKVVLHQIPTGALKRDSVFAC